MGVTNIKLIPILILAVILLSFCVSAQTAADDSAFTRDLQERLSRNQAELLKAIQDTQTANIAAMKTNMDDDFKVLDDSITNKNNSFKKDIAVIIVGGYLFAFTLSQIIRLQIERMRKKSIMEAAAQAEQHLNQLKAAEAELIKNVLKYRTEERAIAAKLDLYQAAIKPHSFFNLKTLAFGFIMIAVGIGIAYITFRVIV